MGTMLREVAPVIGGYWVMDSPSRGKPNLCQLLIDLHRGEGFHEVAADDAQVPAVSGAHCCAAANRARRPGRSARNLLWLCEWGESAVPGGGVALAYHWRSPV